MAPPSRQLFPNRYHAIASSRSSRSSTISSHSDISASTPQTAKLTPLGSEIRNLHLDPRARPPQRTREATNNSDTTASSFQSPYKSPHDASVFVGNLPHHIGDLDLIVALNSHFNRVTKVQHIKVVPDPRNNSRCAFIQVENAEEAQKAVKELGGQDFCGYILRCELARAHRSLLLSIRHPKELRGLDKIEWVRLRRNRGDRTVHVTLGQEAKEEPEVDTSPWPHRDPLQGAGRLISLENLFDEGREETIRELAEVFGAIEQFARFIADDPATVYDPHPRPGSWVHDPKDEKGPDTERGNSNHPRGPWEIKYERRNDSVSAFMALKQIPLFNISRTHTHRPSDIGFLTAGNVTYDPQPPLSRGIFAHLPAPAGVLVDDQRQVAPTASILVKNKAKRMRRGAGTAANARSQPAEDFPPLSKTESTKRPDEDTETGAPKPAGAWKMIKELSEAPKMARSDATKFYERLPLSAAEATTEEPIQQPRAETFKSLEQLIFDSSDSESVRKVENVLGLSVGSSHKAETSRKPMKPTTCIGIMSKIKISGERWDQKRLLGVFSVYQGCLRVDYKLKRKPAGSFVAHVEFETEDQAKAAFEAEKEHPAFGKQMRLVPARRYRDQQPPRVQLQPAPAELIVRNAEQVIEPHVPAEHQGEMEGLSPALSSTLQAESPRPSTSRTDEIEVANLPETNPPTPSAHAASFEEPEQRDEESCIDAMVIEVSEGTVDGDDGGDEKDVIPAETEDYKVGEEPSQGQGEGAPKEQEHALDRLVTSVSTPGLLFGGDSEVELSKIGHLSPTRPLVHRRALSDSDHPKMGCTLDVTLRETIQLPEDVQTALLRLPQTKLYYPHVPEWRESEIQAASPLQQAASSTGSGSEAIPQPEQVSPPISNSSPVTSPTVSPFGALVYIPPPFDSGSTGTSVRHFNSPIPAKGFVETPHGLLPIYPKEVLDRFGRSAPAYYPPQYAVLPQPQWSQPQAWQHQQPGGQWVWSNYPPANHPYSMPLTPGYNQSVHATVAQQQTMVPPQGLQPVDGGNQPGPGAHAHQMSRNSSGEPHGRRRRLSQQRRSRPPLYHDPSPAYNSSQQALSSPHPVNQSYLTPQYNDNGYHQAHSYNSYQAQPMAPQATTEPPSLYPVNDPQAQANLYIQSHSAFNQQQLYSPLPFQSHQQQYQHAPPPFSAAPMYHYSTTQSEPTPGPPTQHSDHPAVTYSVT
ncbi:hypothetical protein FS837_008027 [Tulasnella sp. UAMH 9824]|nr:hypothetical protein FS837_008027 [Tulasnella sp. UAMH 9824]